MTLTTEEIPICNLAECWSIVDLESGDMYRLGGDGAALIWRSRHEAELASDRLERRFVPVKVRVAD